MNKKRIFVSLVLAAALFVNALPAVDAAGQGGLLSAARSHEAEAIESDLTVSTDYIISDKTVLISEGVTVTVEPGAKLTVDVSATLLIDGALVFKSGSLSDIKGTVRINGGGLYEDKNPNADWAWAQGEISGEIFIQRGVRLVLNNTLYVGEKEDGAYITISSGTWAAENDSTLDRFKIAGKDNIYVYNGIVWINKTLPETRVWNLTNESQVYIFEDNAIKFVGPVKGKARVYTYDPVNTIYTDAVNTGESCEFEASSGYSWLEGKWTKVAPIVIPTGMDVAAFLNIVKEIGLTEVPDNPDTWEKWNGASWDGTGTPTNDVGGDGIRYRNIKYTDRGGTRDGLDLYVPAGYKPGDDIPFIMHLHGGGWTGGSKNGEESICAKFANMGFIVAAIDYRLAGISAQTGCPQDEGVFADMIQDIENGVKAAKRKIEELGYKSTSMGITGGSAGGHLALMYAYTHGEDTKGNTLIPVKFAITNCGPADFHWETWMYASLNVFPYNIDLNSVPTKQEGESESDFQQRLDAFLAEFYAKPVEERMLNYEDLREVAAKFTTGLFAINRLIDDYPVQGEDESDEDFKQRSDQFIEDFVNNEIMPWSQKAQELNLLISPAAMAKDALTNPNSIYHVVPTLGLYGGQDNMCHSENAKKLKEALELDENGDHYIIISDLMWHTLSEDSTAAIDMQVQTKRYLETYLRNGEKHVIFKADGRVLSRFNVEPGSSISLSQIPIIPDKTGYTTKGWDKAGEELENITENTIITAKYAANIYKITFKDGDTVIATKTGIYGGKAVGIPQVPQKEGYVGSWDSDDFTFAAEDRVINAVYTKTTYKVTFKDGNTIIAEKTVGHGGTLSDIPEVPKKEGYKGSWDINDFSNITKDITVNAVYTADTIEKKGCKTSIDSFTIIAALIMAIGSACTLKKRRVG